MSNQKRFQIDICQRALQKRKHLFSLCAGLDQWPTPDQIEEVVLILGSSRSGSSLLFYLLSQHPELISLQGEEVVFTKLYRLNEINSFNDSDCLNFSSSTDFKDLAQEMLYDGGYLCHTPNERLAHDRAQRFLLQWPSVDFDLADLYESCKYENWKDVIENLSEKYPEISIARYDGFMDVANLKDPDTFIEEPPFVIPKSKSYQSFKTKKKKLLLKSSINAFRAELIEKLFPNAEIKYIQLTRHPSASINGLMDGWTSNGFHTHNLSHLSELKIDGYSGESWWKFDLPPGWEHYTKKSLAEVCAFQWHSSNRSILTLLQNKNSVCIRYEDLLRFDELIKSLHLICSSLQLDSSFIKNLTPPPAVMSVKVPDQHRWKEKEQLIRPLLSTELISSLARELGYKAEL